MTLRPGRALSTLGTHSTRLDARLLLPAAAAAKARNIHYKRARGATVCASACSEGGRERETREFRALASAERVVNRAALSLSRARWLNLPLHLTGSRSRARRVHLCVPLYSLGYLSLYTLFPLARRATAFLFSPSLLRCSFSPSLSYCHAYPLVFIFLLFLLPQRARLRRRALFPPIFCLSVFRSFSLLFSFEARSQSFPVFILGPNLYLSALAPSLQPLFLDSLQSYTSLISFSLSDSSDFSISPSFFSRSRVSSNSKCFVCVVGTSSKSCS